MESLIPFILAVVTLGTLATIFLGPTALRALACVFFVGAGLNYITALDSAQRGGSYSSGDGTAFLFLQLAILGTTLAFVFLKMAKMSTEYTRLRGFVDGTSFFVDRLLKKSFTENELVNITAEMQDYLSCNPTYAEIFKPTELEAKSRQPQ